MWKITFWPFSSTKSGYERIYSIRRRRTQINWLGCRMFRFCFYSFIFSLSIAHRSGTFTTNKAYLSHWTVQLFKFIYILNFIPIFPFMLPANLSGTQKKRRNIKTNKSVKLKTTQMFFLPPSMIRIRIYRFEFMRQSFPTSVLGSTTASRSATIFCFIFPLIWAHEQIECQNINYFIISFPLFVIVQE